MNTFLQKLSANLKKKLVKKRMPAFEKPMLATLTKNYFSDAQWIFERKFDGVRCLIFKNNNKVSLKSRNNKSLDAPYPEIKIAAQQLKVNQVILDGEVVAFDGALTSFEKLQPRSGLTSAQKAEATGIAIYIYIFDILYLNGYELIHLPLLVRKALLKAYIPFTDPLRYTTHITTKGEAFFHQACKKKWEGIIAKKSDSTYVHARSTNWLKFKCVANQELVIGGYTTPQRSRIGFGALLMGYYKGTDFVYAGKVGTGFSDEFLTGFSKKLKRITIKKNPFSSDDMVDDTVHFVRPHYVAEIGFEEWTKGGKLRQARFQGLRTDKKAKDVVREVPKDS